MTVVGKILVFLNLIFSVAVGAFAVMSYTAGSNHAKGYEELKKQYAVVAASGEQYKKENELLREQSRTFREVITKRGIKEADVKADEYGGTMAKRVVAVIEARDSTIEELKGQLKIAKETATKRDGDVGAADRKADASTTDVVRSRKEIEDMRKSMTTLSTKNGELAGKLSTAIDLRVQAELKANTLEDQVRSLEESQKDLMRELQRMRSPVASREGGPAPPPGGDRKGRPRTGDRDNPPPENVEGTVKKVDRTGLITISVGRDSGLEKGNTLHIFRLGTTPKYIGKIVLVEVQAKQAVGQVQGRPSATIRVNDTVASSILGGF
jgi:hypothetical protein